MIPLLRAFDCELLNLYVRRGRDSPYDVPSNFLINLIRNPVNTGGLVIFYAAGLHEAGSVRSGKEGRVLHTHSHPLPVVTYKARALSSDWFISKLTRALRTLSVKRYFQLSPKTIEDLELTR